MCFEGDTFALLFGDGLLYLCVAKRNDNVDEDNKPSQQRHGGNNSSDNYEQRRFSRILAHPTMSLFESDQRRRRLLDTQRKRTRRRWALLKYVARVRALDTCRSLGQFTFSSHSVSHQDGL